MTRVCLITGISVLGIRGCLELLLRIIIYRIINLITNVLFYLDIVQMSLCSWATTIILMTNPSALIQQ